MCASAVRNFAKLTACIIEVALASHAAPLLAQSGTRHSADNNAWVSIAKPHLYADVLLDTDRFTGGYTLVPKPADVGRNAKIFLVARVNKLWYANDGKTWQPWSGGRTSELPSFTSRVLAASEKLQFINDQNLFAGDYAVFAGYQVGSEDFVYNPKPLLFTVNSHSADTLLPFASADGMKAYLKQGMEKGANLAVGRGVLSIDIATTAAVAPTASAAAASVASRTSSTNVQEQGVDEADTIKVDGNNLYTLASCEAGPCLNVHTLDSANAKAAPLASFTFDTKQAPSGMYFVDHGILGQKMMVTIAGQSYGGGWMSIWGWGASKTELQFINLSYPQVMNSIDKLSIDGSLVESRKVGNVLYVVTRYSPGLTEFTPWPNVQAEVDKNIAVVAKAELSDMLPRIEDSRKKIDALVESKNCFLPASAVDENNNPTIITITSIPLDSPVHYTSTCFLGNSESLYMTESSLYLATTSWHYDVQTLATSSFAYSPNHTTSLHKFALNNGNVEYRGSGEVKGHLGWAQDKKSFRMGEHNEYLNIATSIGETWTGTSSTRLTVLKEDASKHTLQTVSVIDGIGLKNEQLYAARFLGDRGYLVTFRLADPLYVLDLSNQEKPRIAGGLKIDGYSDYLHPVSDTLLLGIGKAAVADVAGDDGRGAFYQGVKLSLFDVSNLASPKEINSVVIGKRGTDSAALWDHHAVSFLPAAGNEPARLALPIQVNETMPAYNQYRGAVTSPWFWYDYTHTALYSFEISKAGVSNAGRLISEVAAPVTTTAAVSSTAAVRIDSGFVPIYAYYSDRSVLKDNAVFYIHNGKVLSAYWGESK